MTNDHETFEMPSYHPTRNGMLRQIQVKKKLMTMMMMMMKKMMMRAR